MMERRDRVDWLSTIAIALVLGTLVAFWTAIVILLLWLAR